MDLTCIEAEKLYKRDAKVKREDVASLQDWLQKQPHLPKLEESQVILFLHSCYYSIEAAKNTIDAYFTRRTLHSDLFHCASEEILKKTLSVHFKQFMPKKTPQGYEVIVSKLLDERAENYNFNNEVMLTNLFFSLRLHKNGFEEGVVGIFDFKGASLGHLARANLSSVKQALIHVQEGIPLRIKGLHLVNAPSFMDKIMNLIKPFLSGQLFELIQIHSSFDSLYEYVPRELLPEDYGGDLPTCETMQENSVREIFDNLDFFKWHDSQMVDESKRLEKLKCVDPNFGMEGTFKKLQID